MGLKFNDIDLKTNYNFVVIEVQGRGSPPVSRTILDHPLVHGDIELSAKLRSRDIVIRGYVYGSDLATKKDSLIKLITQAYETECKLTFPDTNRSIYVKLAGEPIVIGPIGPVLNAQAYEITFRFTAQDPYFYGEDHDEVGFNIVKVNANAPTYLISPRRKFLKREPSISIYPYTIINLLGRYGNFEVDSNGDGVPDGWSPMNIISGSASLVNGFIGTKAYKSSYIADDNAKWNHIVSSFRVPVTAGETYLCAFYGKYNTNNPSPPSVFCNLHFLVNWNAGNDLRVTISSTTWRRYYETITFADSGNAWVEGLYTNHSSLPDGYLYEVWIDGLCIYNLSLMGQLPPPLKEYFSNQVSLWSDLATTSNITGADGRTQSGNAWLAELIPYVDSVASFGFVWQ